MNTKFAMIAALVIGVALLIGAASYATADTAVIYGSGAGSKAASDTVTVKATVNPKLTLTVVTTDNTQTVDFGAVDPGTAYGPKAVNLTVQSNKTYNITKTVTGAAPIGLNTSLANSTNNVRTAGQAYTDNYSINVPWTTDPGSYTATVQYSVVQN